MRSPDHGQAAATQVFIHLAGVHEPHPAGQAAGHIGVGGESLAEYGPGIILVLQFVFEPLFMLVGVKLVHGNCQGGGMVEAQRGCCGLSVPYQFAHIAGAPVCCTILVTGACIIKISSHRIGVHPVTGIHIIDAPVVPGSIATPIVFIGISHTSAPPI